MRLTLVICVFLLFATMAVGQQAVSPQMGPAMSAPPVVVLAPYGGLLVQGGYATTVGLSYPPLLVTPTATLSIVSANPVGASNGTSNLQVGANNSTFDSLAMTLPAVQTVMEISPPGLLGPMGYSQSAPPAGEYTSSAAGLGAAHFDVVNARGPGDLRGVAEAAREIRKQPKPAGVRTFTNADVQSLIEREKSAQEPR